jgi:hypothetical protein
MYQRQRFVPDAEHTDYAFAKLCRRWQPRELEVLEPVGKGL